MSQSHPSLLPSGVGLGRFAAATCLMCCGAVLAFHRLSDSTPWAPPFLGGDAWVGALLFLAGLVFLLFPVPGRQRVPAEQEARRARIEDADPSIDTAGLEALIRWNEKLQAGSAARPVRLPPLRAPVGSGRDFSVGPADRD